MLREFFTQDFNIALILICLVLVVITRQLFSTRFEDFLAIIWNDRYLKIYTRDQKKIDVFNLLLFLNFVFTAGIFVKIGYDSFQKPIDDNHFLLPLLFVVISVVFIIKSVIERLIGRFFEFSGFAKLYIFQKTTYKNFSGLLLLVLNTLLLFSSLDKLILIYTTIALLIIVNISGFIRFVISQQKVLISNFFYFLLYLCALEIGPYVILYKVFKDYFE